MVHARKDYADEADMRTDLAGEIAHASVEEVEKGFPDNAGLNTASNGSNL